MLALRAYRSGDAKKIAPWLNDEQVFTWWSAGALGAYPLAAQTLDAYYVQHIKEDGWMPKVMEEDGETVGSMLLRFKDEETIHFGMIIVNPDARGKGYGSAMLNLALEYAFHIKRAKRVTVNVFGDNMPARRCYERLGFVCAREVTTEIGGRQAQLFQYEKKPLNA